MRRLLITAAGAVLLFLLGWQGASPLRAMRPVRDDPQDPAPIGLPAIYPVPQSEQPRQERIQVPNDVTIVAGPTADASALSLVRQVLAASGSTALNVVPSSAAAGSPTGLTVYVGGDPAAEQALDVTGSSGLPAGGYVLAAGTSANGRSLIVLDGVDGAGQFYAAHTLRQLIAGAHSFQGAVIRDWPSFAVRGVVEGFYGTPWSLDARLSMLDWLGAHKQNAYVYAPKNDPYDRELWRTPYPADAQPAMAELVGRAAADHVTFTFSLSPGLSMCYSSAADQDALFRKLLWAWDAGVRSFAIAFDDIDITRPICAGDKVRYGTGPAGVGTAEARLVNRVMRDFITARSAMTPLVAVPAEYSGVASTPYIDAFARVIAPGIVVQWTGRYGVSLSIKAAEAAAARRAFGYPLLIWDNYYVNDYLPGFINLGPVSGRDPQLATQVLGITADPLQEPEASKIGLFTVADYSWNADGYDPAGSWDASLREFAGGNPCGVDALRSFGDANYSSPLNPVQAPALSAAIHAFWQAWNTGEGTAAATLDARLRKLRDSAAAIRSCIDNPTFLQETEPWLNATQSWAAAAMTALDLIVARRAGAADRAGADAQALPQQIAVASSFTHDGAEVQVAPSVLAKFVAQAS